MSIGEFLFLIAALITTLVLAALGASLVVQWFRGMGDLIWISELEPRRTALTMIVLSLAAVLLLGVLIGRGANGQVPLMTILAGLVLLIPLATGPIVHLWSYRSATAAAVRSAPTSRSVKEGAADRAVAEDTEAAVNPGMTETASVYPSTSSANEGAPAEEPRGRWQQLTEYLSQSRGYVFTHAEARQRAAYSPPPYAALTEQELSS